MKQHKIFSPVCVYLLALATQGYPLASQAQSTVSDIKISPISMSANTPGLEINEKTIGRWVAQTELSPKQLEDLGVKAGKLNESFIQKLPEMNDDPQSRRLINFLDGEFSLSSLGSDRNLNAAARNTAAQTRPPGPSNEPWKTWSTLEPFIQDAVELRGGDAKWEADLREALQQAAMDGDGINQVITRSKAQSLLLEARGNAVRRARSYRQLADIVRRELDSSREFVKNIELVVEVRTASKQPTIAPVSRVVMECSRGSERRPSLVFSQRKRDCNEFGVCKIESISEVSAGGSSDEIFKELQKRGREYLDSCQLHTTMLVDGVEVTKALPGKFTAHAGSVSP